MINYVIGIITDGTRVLLLKKSDPDWPRGLYDGIGGRVTEETLLETIIKKCKNETGLDILEWTELDTILLPIAGSTLTYFSTIIDKDKIETVQNTLEYEELELFDIKNLPRNIVFDLKNQIKNTISVEIKSKNRKRLKKIFVYIGYFLIILFLILMIFGKNVKEGFLYLIQLEQNVELEDYSKKQEFKKGFNGRILGF